MNEETPINPTNFSNLGPMWQEIHRLADKFKEFLPSILFAIIVLIGFYFLSGLLRRGIRRLWKRKFPNPFLLSILTRLSLLPVWLLLFYFMLRILGLSTLGATLIGGTGVLGIILGLAFKGIAENYLAGLLLAFRSPFNRGDLIQIGQYKGYVQNLNMRGTTIIDLRGNLILIPNLMVIQSVVENQTANPKMRTSFDVSIGYQDSISMAQELIVKAVIEVEGVISDPPPNVIAKELGKTGIDLSVRLWFDSRKDREMRVRSRAMIKTKETLITNGFSFPTEVRELIFTNQTKVENQTVKAQSESEAKNATRDPTPEEMLRQADVNPLPTDFAETNLLKKT